MNKKIGIILGVLIVAVAGAVYFGYQSGLFTKEGAGGALPGGGVIPGGGGNTVTETPQGGEQGAGQTGQKGVYASAEEIAAPTGLPSELKSIFSEACGGAKLTTLNYNFPAQGADMLVYVWKNEPTEEKLISAFEKNGYKIEESGGGGMLYVKKGNNISLVVDWASPDREEGQEIVVLAGKEE